jgi:hypothetical protein
MSDAAASACATIDRVVANLQNDSIVAHDRPAVRCVGKELGALRRCRFMTPIHYLSVPGRSGVLWALHQAANRNSADLLVWALDEMHQTPSAYQIAGCG